MATGNSGIEGRFSQADLDDSIPVIIGDSGEVREAGTDDASDSIPLVEPATIIGEADPGDSPGRRRGRPRGSKNTATSRKAEKQTAQDLTGVLLSVHFMLSKIAKAPELELDDAEAKRLGEALARVNELYEGMVMSPKQLAWLNLIVAGGAVYGPRFVAIQNRKKTEAEAQPITIDAIPTSVH